MRDAAKPATVAAISHLSVPVRNFAILRTSAEPLSFVELMTAFHPSPLHPAHIVTLAHDMPPSDSICIAVGHQATICSHPYYRFHFSIADGLPIATKQSMASLKPSRDMWLVLSAPALICAAIRYFGGSAVIYTLSYAMLVIVGIGIAVFLLANKRSYFRAEGSLWFATLAPPVLLFIDLASGWRVICSLVMALVGIMEWNSERGRLNVS